MIKVSIRYRIKKNSNLAYFNQLSGKIDAVQSIIKTNKGDTM